jgi:hypothetical protein
MVKPKDYKMGTLFIAKPWRRGSVLLGFGLAVLRVAVSVWSVSRSRPTLPLLYI